MKKVLKVFSTLLVFVANILVFSGCENFFDGNLIKDELDNLIEYANASYADITINSINVATESIVPATGNYNNKYKKTDKINLSFTPVSNYQFIKWTASPEGSVLFENDSSTVTKAEVMNIDSPITIEPMVYARPEVTVSPGNAVENPKNSTIVISFNTPLDISEADLSKIAITVDDISVLANYKAPYFNAEKTKITFVPKRDNLIDVQSGVKVVKVSVPSYFYYTKDDVKISLTNDYSYSFKINSTTETNVEVTVNCPSSQGDLSYTGTKVYYLDNEFTVKCTPKTGYSLTGWGVVYNDDNSVVEDNVLEFKTSEDGTEATVKVLTGSSRAITFLPVLIEQGSVTVSFSTKHGYTVPADSKLYYVDDVFNVSYREEQGFVFTGWQVQDAAGNIVNDVLEIKNPNSAETECKVLKESAGVKLVANTSSRPAVVNISPNYSGGATYRDSRITILFGEKMSEKAIYWTKEELTAEGITEDLYDYIESGSREYESGKKYIYAYKEKSDAEENTIKFRNIEINELNKGTNFLKYYDEPFYESSNNTMLIIPAKKPDNGVERCVPASNYVKVTVKSSFCSYNMIPTNAEKYGYFFTNGQTDNVAPDFTLTGIQINSNAGVIVDNTNFINSNLATYRTTYGSKKLSIQLNTMIKDVDSGPSSLQVKLTPIDGMCPYQRKKEYTETVTLSPTNGTDECDYRTNPLIIDIDLKDKYEGAYAISFTCYDNRNNESAESNKYGFIYDDRISPTLGNDIYCPIRNFTKGNLASAKFGINNLTNCEFTVYNAVNTEIWTPTEEIVDLNKIWDAGDTRLSREHDSLTLYVKVRDAFEEKERTYSNYLKYEWKSTLNVSKSVITGRGTILTYELVVGEDCTNVYKLYTHVGNSESSSCIITGVYLGTKLLSLNHIDGTSNTGIYLSSVLTPNSEGVVSFTTLFRGLDSKLPVVGTVQFEDSNGGKTDEFTIDIP